MRSPYIGIQCVVEKMGLVKRHLIINLAKAESELDVMQVFVSALRESEAMEVAANTTDFAMHCAKTLTWLGIEPPADLEDRLIAFAISELSK